MEILQLLREFVLGDNWQGAYIITFIIVFFIMAKYCKGNVTNNYNLQDKSINQQNKIDKSINLKNNKKDKK